MTTKKARSRIEPTTDDKHKNLPSVNIEPTPPVVAETAKAQVSRRSTPQSINRKKALGFPIIGIGASAGGLAAMEAFFSALPAETVSGMAVVIVQHLSPDHKSILCELIKRYTPMEVFEVTDGLTVKRNCAYIIPPSKDMAFIDGKLILLEPEASRGHRLPIDYFFRSLAEDQQSKAICIILSGTGSDGTLGARAIKGVGGLVIAQKPDTTEFDGMPQSIIINGLADYILPPKEIPATLIAYASHTHNYIESDITPPAQYVDVLNKIFVLIRTRTGHDFSRYKPKTIVRRLERRLLINQIDSLPNYYLFLQNSLSEIDALFHDFLIGVTNFFRDPEAFEVFKEQIIPLLFINKPVGSVCRVWIPACSTGEEAYSIAILLYEYSDKYAMDYGVQIFATDIDHTSIEHARAGIYTANIAADVSPEHLSRYFSQSADQKTYQVRKTIRELVVFSEQDILKDPPFSRMDFISCRNLLIYMNTELQSKVIPMFHYALNDMGILFLGSSESPGTYTDLFTPISRKWKIYQRQIGQTPRSRVILNPTKASHPEPLQAKKAVVATREPISLKELAETELLSQYTPAAVIINVEGEALYFQGRTGKYLEPAPGEAETKLVKMAREGLARDLASAIHKAVIFTETVCCPGLKVKTNGAFTTVRLTVKPLSINPERLSLYGEELFLVIFEDVPDIIPEYAIHEAGKKSVKCAEYLKAIAVLEREVRSKEEYIQASIEEMETTSEEFKSTNEELQSVNEELQSTNEELETSKEELQSVNEELGTVNAELQDKILHLSKAENDMSNLLSSTGVGTIFVDLNQLIKRYTPAADKIVKLIKRDIGRPIGDLVTNLVDYDCLAEDIQKVLDNLVPIEKQIQAKDGAWFLLRILPYRTLENLIDGAVITFFDVTMHKKAEKVLEEYNTLRRLTAVVNDAYDAILKLDLKGNILAWNPAAKRMYGYSDAEAQKLNIFDLMPSELKADMQSVFANLSSLPLKPFKTERICRDGKTIPVLVTATALIDQDGAVYSIAMTEQQI